MRIVVNHLTRMQSGYICVAGIDVQDNQHIRSTRFRQRTQPGFVLATPHDGFLLQTRRHFRERSQSAAQWVRSGRGPRKCVFGLPAYGNASEYCDQPLGQDQSTGGRRDLRR